jgi:N-acetylmuramic acid 6-phosphate etherase
MIVVKMDSKSKHLPKQLLTEQQNPKTGNLDQMSISEILSTINKEDQTVAAAVKNSIPQIEKVVTLAIDALKKGNRIYYVGAGTSGRLGMLDAAEIPPTFSAPDDWFRGIIAGGREAVFQSIEGAEDKVENVTVDLKQSGISKGDLIIGIATSSTTPYVLSALKIASSQGMRTAFIICNPNADLKGNIDVTVVIETGPEILTGSTRMKAGTATKMVLNMISTATMIKMGKVYGNLMVDLKVVNKKLLGRGVRIISQLTGITGDQAENLLNTAGNSVKIAIVMNIKSCSKDQAERILENHQGNLRAVVGDLLNIDE